MQRFKMNHLRNRCFWGLHSWILIYCILKTANAAVLQNRTTVKNNNNTSVERSVSVSFDNTKIYFFGDKIEFAGEVHNRYPEQVSGTGSSSDKETDQNGHLLRKWGTPVPPGLRPLRPMPRVHYIDAECQNDNMKISILFNGSFTGLIYSSKYAYNPDCLYVNGTGSQRYEFYIRLNRCGTLGGGPKGRDAADDKKMMWNTLTIQYNPLIEEEYDQHFRVTCEYGYQFWKKVSFPVVDVKIPTERPLLFTLSPPECQMEIRRGFDLDGIRVSGPVNVGDPLTLVIYMRSQTVGFDIIINNCVAHNGASKRMALIDDSGCPLENKIISDFKGVDLHHGVYESKVYAYFKAFRFTGSPALYIECDVRMCHGICPKQRCYWRNLRGGDKEDSIHGRQKNDTLVENRNTTNTTVPRPKGDVVKPVYWNSSSISPLNISTTTARPPTSSTNAIRKVAKPTSTSTSTTPLQTPTMIALRLSTLTSSTTPSSTTKKTPITTKLTNITSNVNLNINNRRVKRNPRIKNRLSSKEANNTISETVNLFQALEVRSEPPGEAEDYTLAEGIQGSVVCIKTVGLTAIICVFVLIVTLAMSISLMLCARLRRLQVLHENLGIHDKYNNSKNMFSAMKVHRTS